MSKHLKILALADPELLSNEKIIESFFYSLLKNLNMRPLGTPQIFNVPLEIQKLNSEVFMDEGGITINGHGIEANITLSTSHLALHCFPLRNEMHLDIYSCREFNKNQIEEFVIEYFKCYKTKISDLTEYTIW